MLHCMDTMHYKYSTNLCKNKCMNTLHHFVIKTKYFFALIIFFCALCCDIHNTLKNETFYLNFKLKSLKAESIDSRYFIRKSASIQN